jgi:hypothetical protein
MLGWQSANRTWGHGISTLLGWLLAGLCAAVPCAGQSIANVSVSKKPGSQAQTTDFTLKITGKDFGTNKAQVSLKVAPQASILQGPVVSDLSQDGTVIIATFTAPDNYDPSTVVVQVGAATGEPYVISAAAGEGELKKYIKIYRSIVDPQTVADIFGRRIAKRFVVIQVTVTNRNKDYQFVIHDISLDLSKIVGSHYEVSSTELSLLRGVAEKGQSADRRNVVIRSLRGAGNVAAGLIGIAHFGKSYAPSVAVWNGPVISAVSDIFPDYTINQMNRLNDSAYSANSIIPKEHAKVVAIFLPEAIFLSRDQAREFWRDPTSLWGDLDLRKLGVYVDGNFITNVEDLSPSLTTAAIDPAEMKKLEGDKPQVKGSISGSYLSGTDIKLLNSDLPGVSIRLDGTPTDKKLDFVVKSDHPISPGKFLKIGVSKGARHRQGNGCGHTVFTCGTYPDES